MHRSLVGRFTPEGGTVVQEQPSKIPWKTIWQVVTLILVILAVVVVGISLFRSSDADNIVRFCFEATPEAVVGGTGEAGGWLDGTFELDTESNRMTLYGSFSKNMSQITSILIMGPRPFGEKTGPEYFSICGAPNLVNVCDVLSVPWHVEQVVTQIQPSAEDPRPVIKAIRAQPTPNYYIEVRTSSFPTSPGALRASLDKACGFP